MKTKTAMILAAGFGKRLLPLTKKVPKPLIEAHGKSLLGHTIDMLTNCGVKHIVINVHYKSNLIRNYIKQNYNNYSIKILNEKKLLDTGGGVKNALNYFKEKSIIVTNSDIYWHKKNYSDINKLLNKFDNKKFSCLLLLSKLSNFKGIKNNKGDFIFIKNNLLRNNYKNQGLIYSGLQILDLSIFKKFNNRIFSFNEIWDLLIKQNKLSGIEMSSKLIHLGSSEDLKFIKKYKP